MSNRNKPLWALLLVSVARGKACQTGMLVTTISSMQGVREHIDLPPPPI